MFVAAVLALAVAGLWLVPPIDDARAMPSAVGTSGTHAGAAENHGGDVITEIETITATTNATELVGRRVDLHVDVQERANDRAFWVGSRDNRVLVGAYLVRDVPIRGDPVGADNDRVHRATS